MLSLPNTPLPRPQALVCDISLSVSICSRLNKHSYGYPLGFSVAFDEVLPFLSDGFFFFHPWLPPSGFPSSSLASLLPLEVTQGSLSSSCALCIWVNYVPTASTVTNMK